MGKFRIEIEELADKHLKMHYKAGNQANIKKIAKILKQLTETPFEGIGNPEPLKHKLTGFWSREINKKDRLIYKVEENIVTIFLISDIGHYSDK